MKPVFEFSKLAKKKFDRLPLQTRLFIAKKMEVYAEQEDPYYYAKKLKGHANRYRFKAGDYRVICKKIKNKLVIVIIDVGHRKDIYE